MQLQSKEEEISIELIIIYKVKIKVILGPKLNNYEPKLKREFEFSQQIK